MRDYLFSVNKENAYSLQKKFSLDEDETEYLHRNFWPIITLTEIEVDEFQGLLNKEKSEFRKKRGRFVIELFKRDYLDFLIDELNSYLDNINRRRNKIYNVVSDTYFHWFKLEADIKTYTLLLSKKDELNLEIYFIDLLDVIKSFISENETLPPQQNDKPKPEPKETELSERIKKHFGFFNRNCPRKHKQILNDTDFEKLIEWTIWYFENDFKVPEISEPIKVVNTNKTFVQLAFKYLFKELHKSSPYPETLFEFYQSAFTPFSEDKKSNFEAVKNNDEVKKLMQIDY